MDAREGYAVVRDGDNWLVCERPTRVVTARGREMFAALDEIADDGFWVGFIAYEAGRNIEHIEARAEARTDDDDNLDLPDIAFVRFSSTRVVTSALAAELTGRAPGCAMPNLGAGESSLDRAAHARRVAAVHALLEAGECYQVNLTRRLSFAPAADPLALFGALNRLNPSPYSGVCVFGDALPGLAVVSASPELFLRVDDRVVETRPIKGTGADAEALRVSPKDHAENLMIVDLARNDLGRVCEFGSVEVPSLFAVEEHPGLAHLVSTVRGRLRAYVRFADLVRATFPPASVTGAPKPRVLQAIEDLEPVKRGVYCGAFGWIDGSSARAQFAVAIRTFTTAGGRTHLGVGGGIVADSCADDEWAETELKCARLLEAAGARADERIEAR